MAPGATSRPPYVHHIPYTLAHTTKNPIAAASHAPDVAHEDQYSPASPQVPVVRSLEGKHLVAHSYAPLHLMYLCYSCHNSILTDLATRVDAIERTC